jgi:hypothetical protein
MMNDNASNQSNSSDVGLQTIGMLRTAQLWSAGICEISAAKYRFIIDKIADNATYYKINGKQEIEFATDGRPMNYMTKSLLFRRITGSVVIAAGTNEKAIKEKLDLLKLSLQNIDKEVKVFHGSDELPEGLVRVTIHSSQWWLRVLEMAHVLENLEEAFVTPAMSKMMRGSLSVPWIRASDEPKDSGFETVQ